MFALPRGQLRSTDLLSSRIAFLRFSQITFVIFVQVGRIKGELSSNSSCMISCHKLEVLHFEFHSIAFVIFTPAAGLPVSFPIGALWTPVFPLDLYLC